MNHIVQIHLWDVHIRFQQDGILRYETESKAICIDDKKHQLIKPEYMTIKKNNDEEKQELVGGVEDLQFFLFGK